MEYGEQRALGNPLQYLIKKVCMVIPSGLRCVRGRSPLHPLTPVLSGPDPLHSPCDPEHIHAGQTFYTINFRKETFSVPLTSVPQHGTRLKTPVPGYFGSSISPSQLSTSGFPQALTTAYPSSSPSPQARPARSQLWAPSGLREGGGSGRSRKRGGRQGGPSSPWRSRREEPKSGWTL